MTVHKEIVFMLTGLHGGFMFQTEHIGITLTVQDDMNTEFFIFPLHSHHTQMMDVCPAEF